MSVLYPIAANAEEALKTPRGRAVREREAQAIACEAVTFARELTGPVFSTREAAEAANAGRVDAEGAAAVAPEDRFCELMEVAEPVAGRPPRGGQAEPALEGGRRWPAPKRMMKTVWRLSVGYWRIGAPATEPLPQARAARRAGGDRALDATALRAMVQQPLQPMKPQQPLDIGLFEVNPPEAPHINMPDE